MNSNWKRISVGKYRYRGHIIWYDRRLVEYCCSPDPSGCWVHKSSLRQIKRYIDDWEQAFDENRVNGNFIFTKEGMWRGVIDAFKRISANTQEISLSVKRLLSQYCEQERNGV